MIFLLLILALSFPRSVFALNSDTINATVKVNICGNAVVEPPPEACDGADLNSSTCQSLGFTTGILACSVSCDFNKSSCSTPITTVSANTIDLLFTNDTLTPESGSDVTSTPNLTVTSASTIKTDNSATASIVSLPATTIITTATDQNFDATQITLATITPTSLSGLSSQVQAISALQWGLTDTTLAFSKPLTVTLYVGTSYEGQTLNVVRSISGQSGWTTDGIVSPATCTITQGVCTFQTTKASFFAATTIISTSTSTSTQSNTSQSNTLSTTPVSSSNNSPSPRLSLASPITDSPLARIMSIFTPTHDLELSLPNLVPIINRWISLWKNDTTTNGSCDLNLDGSCNLADLSVLLYYIKP